MSSNRNKIVRDVVNLEAALVEYRRSASAARRLINENSIIAANAW